MDVIRFFQGEGSILNIIIPMTIVGFVLIVVAVVWVIYRLDKLSILKVSKKLMWDFGEGGCLARGHGFSNVDSKLFEDVCIVISQIESSIVVQWKKIF